MTPQPRPEIPAIPPDREDGSSTFVHLALIITGHIGRIEPAMLLPAWAALVAIACWPWQALRLPAAVASTIFVIADWAMLGLLPVKRRSWGPVTPSLLGLTVVRAAAFWIGALIAPGVVSLTITILAQTLVSGIAFYATWIEPFRIGVTRLQYRLPNWRGAPLRILHISDIHFEGFSPREKELLAKVEELHPDLILLTGDYLNLSSVYDPAIQQDVRHLLGQLRAPLGIYAVTGSPVVDVEGIVPHIFEGLPIHWLMDEAVPLNGASGAIWLLGIRCTYKEARDATALTQLAQRTPPDAFALLLYHTPDLMPDATRAGIDLYLCGHTHGGQIRLPVYGALATSSRWGKRYEMGRYCEGKTTLYVSRGLGVEGAGAPRARFLTPPEIILWEVGSDS